ncbi:type I DNA topoisomerase, partial [bacterium]|nr:type I DNA topoisomerase [bacterium]
LKDPKRITFHEITPSAIKEALKHPRSILEELVNAQKARRVIDRLFGYKLSPFLWKKILRGLSAGRVQSAALRLIVEREKEIREFKPKDFYRLRALFETDPSFSAYLEKIGKKALKKFAFRKPDKLEAIKKEIQGKPFVVKEVSSSLRLIQPPAPFITATLQQEAFRRLGFSAKQTMVLAQQLYEGVQINSRRVGLITYMRTDSPSLAKEAVSAIRGFIEKRFGQKYLPPSPRQFRAPKHAQEAHEAIRPTDISLTPEKVKPFLEEDQFRLYELIFWRTIASQMKPAEALSLVVWLYPEGKRKYLFRGTGYQIKFESFLRFYPLPLPGKPLPSLKEKQKLTPSKLEVLALKTKPKPRYTEATLVRKLKELGIGRPSTYAPIIDILFKRRYIKRLKRYLVPTELGEKVVEFLLEHFPHLIEYRFTAEMEKELDEIAEGKRDWVKAVRDFYEPLEKLLKKKDAEIKKEEVVNEKVLARRCPKCGGKLVVKLGRFGRFISCENFPRCDYKESLNDHLEESLSEEEKAKLKKLRQRYPQCPQCGGELILRKSRFGVFLGCKNYPKCRFVVGLNETEKE